MTLTHRQARPHDFEYSFNVMLTRTNATFVPNPVKVLNGKPPFEFSVEPALPAGLRLVSGFVDVFDLV